MTIQELSGKSVCILGFGREGKAMLEAIEREQIDCRVTVADQNEKCEMQNEKCEMQLGKEWLADLDRFDVIIKSPGIPPSPILTSHVSRLTSSTQIFLDTVLARGASVIGVTGSKGKSTTSSLIHAILQRSATEQEAKSQQPIATSHLVGNIGEPSIAHIGEAKEGVTFVLEMSSYQLMDLTTSPPIAVVTSFFPEHLDYHGSLDAYMDAKKHITRFQGPDHIAFFCAGDPGAAAIAAEGPGRKIPFSADDAPVRLEETHLIGRHNLRNIGAATRVARELGVPDATIIAAVKAFHGLPHRLQRVGVVDSIEWIDDAISTTPESTIAGLDALEDKVTTLILGGQDRGYDFSALAGRLAHSSVRTVILFPGSGPRIREAIERTGAPIRLFDAASMEEAVRIAKETRTNVKGQMSNTPPIVLLSTASPSYGMFKNFEEKGEKFQECIKDNDQ